MKFKHILNLISKDNIMANQIMKTLVDLMYGTTRVKRKYELDNPNEKILASDGSKGIVTTINQEIQHGLDWVTSQRAVILLTDKKIICGKWTIMLEDISAAQLLKINSLLGGGHVLKIQTKDGKNYQFGMYLNTEWTNQEVLPLTIEKGKVKYSLFSIIVRLILFGCIIYLLFLRQK